jgi:hypothetical protein
MRGMYSLLIKGPVVLLSETAANCGNVCVKINNKLREGERVTEGR